MRGVNGLALVLCYSHTVRFGRPGGSGEPRWPLLREMLGILGGQGIFYLHPGVILVVPGLIPVSFRVETSRKTLVLPGCSRCPPGVLPVFPDQLVPPRYGGGVFSEDPGCRCIPEPPQAHRGHLGVFFIFLGHGLYFYISN